MGLFSTTWKVLILQSLSDASRVGLVADGSCSGSGLSGIGITRLQRGSGNCPQVPTDVMDPLKGSSLKLDFKCFSGTQLAARDEPGQCMLDLHQACDDGFAVESKGRRFPARCRDGLVCKAFNLTTYGWTPVAGITNKAAFCIEGENDTAFVSNLVTLARVEQAAELSGYEYDLAPEDAKENHASFGPAASRHPVRPCIGSGTSWPMLTRYRRGSGDCPLLKTQAKDWLGRQLSLSLKCFHGDRVAGKGETGTCRVDYHSSCAGEYEYMAEAGQTFAARCPEGSACQTFDLANYGWDSSVSESRYASLCVDKSNITNGFIANMVLKKRLENAASTPA